MSIEASVFNTATKRRRAESRAGGVLFVGAMFIVIGIVIFLCFEATVSLSEVSLP